MMNESVLPRSSMNEFPVEILCEIFSRCVDQSSAQVLMQPNTTIAPMLLCQVCATWRAVALSQPSLWSHLRFELPLDWFRNDDLSTWNSGVFVRRLEWLGWWKRNLGPIAPYLQIEVRQSVELDYRPRYDSSPISNPASVFLLDLMSSAQYLSVGRLYQYLVQQLTKAGHMVKMHPNAHTIVAVRSSASEFESSLDFHQYLISILTETRSTLRHLVIEKTQLEHEDLTSPLHQWSTLTHLSLHRLFLHLNNWFSFIRSLSALQSGSFHLFLLDNNIDTYKGPPISILRYALSFDISISVNESNGENFPLKTALENLQFPALRSLSLQSQARTWRDFTAISEVHAALLSAPAITKLSLGMLFLGGQAFDSRSRYGARMPIRSEIERLVTYAPRLESLSFVVKSPLRRHGGSQFPARVFYPSRWLDLKSPTSTIKEIILIACYRRTKQRLTWWRKMLIEVLWYPKYGD